MGLIKKPPGHSLLPLTLSHSFVSSSALVAKVKRQVWCKKLYPWPPVVCPPLSPASHRQTLTIHSSRLTGQRDWDWAWAWAWAWAQPEQPPRARPRPSSHLAPFAACRLPLAVCSCLKSHINNENCTVAKSLNGKILQASTLLMLLLPCSNAVDGGTTLCCTAAHTSVCGKVIGLRALCA